MKSQVIIAVLSIPPACKGYTNETIQWAKGISTDAFYHNSAAFLLFTAGATY